MNRRRVIITATADFDDEEQYGAVDDLIHAARATLDREGLDASISTYPDAEDPGPTDHDVADYEQELGKALQRAINYQGIDARYGTADWELVELILQAPSMNSFIVSHA